GNLQPIGQDIVTVEAHQWVRIDEQSTDAGQNQHAIGQLMYGAIPGVCPKHDRQGCDLELDIDAGYSSDNALPLGGESPRGRDIDKGSWNQQDQKQAGPRHVAAKRSAGNRVSKFVN